MQIRKIKGLKKSGTLTLAAMMAVLSMSTTAFASSPQYISEEGIGIEVHNPETLGVGKIKARKYINDNYVKVGGGTLWTTWDGGSRFRSNYTHNSKTHRCSVTNDHLECKRSGWVSKKRQRYLRGLLKH